MVFPQWNMRLNNHNTLIETNGLSHKIAFRSSTEDQQTTLLIRADVEITDLQRS